MPWAQQSDATLCYCRHQPSSRNCGKIAVAVAVAVGVVVGVVVVVVEMIF